MQRGAGHTAAADFERAVESFAANNPIGNLGLDINPNAILVDALFNLTVSGIHEDPHRQARAEALGQFQARLAVETRRALQENLRIVLAARHLWITSAAGRGAGNVRASMDELDRALVAVFKSPFGRDSLPEFLPREAAKGLRSRVMGAAQGRGLSPLRVGFGQTNVWSLLADGQLGSVAVTRGYEFEALRFAEAVRGLTAQVPHARINAPRVIEATVRGIRGR